MNKKIFIIEGFSLDVIKFYRNILENSLKTFDERERAYIVLCKVNGTHPKKSFGGPTNEDFYSEVIKTNKLINAIASAGD